MQKHCNTCKLLVSQNGKQFCGLGRYQVTPEADYCSRHRDTLDTCEICGAVLIEPGIIDMQDGSPHLICSSCLSKMKTCALCDRTKECLFETSPSTTPKVVNKVISQGPMQVTTNVMNPDRIQETCKTDCPCWNDELGCLRKTTTQTCGQWAYTYAERNS